MMLKRTIKVNGVLLITYTALNGLVFLVLATGGLGADETGVWNLSTYLGRLGLFFNILFALPLFRWKGLEIEKRE